MKKEEVNSPAHYSANGVDVIDVIEAFELSFCLGNVIKYVLRADRKADKREDLMKAQWYLQKEISKMKQ